MTGEPSIVAGLITEIKGLSEFASADVTDSDFGLLDGSSLDAPYVVFESSDEWDIPLTSSTNKSRWNIPATLFERFMDWKTSLPNLRSNRQAIIDHFNDANNAVTADGLDGVQVTRIRAAGPITPVYDRYLRDEELPEALPVFLSQRFIFEVEEF